MSSEEEKNKLLNSIMEIYFADGINISMDEIASRLRISKKTIYKHFKNKSDILDNVQNFLYERARRIFDKFVKSSDNPIDALVLAFAELPKLFGILSRKFLSDIKRYELDRWKKIDNFRTEMFMKTFPPLLKKGQKIGYFRKDINFEILLRVYLSAIQAIINPDVLSNAPFTIDEAIKGILKIIYQGINTEKGRERFEKTSKLIKNKKELHI